MDSTGWDDDRQPLMDRPLCVSAVFGNGEDIAEARALARNFLDGLRTAHALPVSGRATGMVQLVVSELVTNARKYAPGPCLLRLELGDGAVEVTVWDSSTVLPAVLAPDPSRIGQHGLEIVTAVCRGFEVHREPVGKRIRAAVPLTGPLEGDAGRAEG